MDLFEECLDALKDKATPLTLEESDILLEILQCLFPFICANIDWEKVEKKIFLDSNQPDIILNLKKLLKNSLDESIYILWDTPVPVLKTNLSSAISYFDDITCISVRTWFLNLNQGYVLEWHWCGFKVIGLADKEKVFQCNTLKMILDSLSPVKFFSRDETKIVYRMFNRFSQPKYWIISDPYFVKTSIEIIPHIEKTLKNSINKDVYLLWNDKSFPVLQVDLDKVIAIWNKISTINIPFKIIGINAEYLINVGLDNTIDIILNFGLKKA